MTEARTVAVARIEPAAKDQSILTLARAPEIEAAYRRPGQYCQLSLAAPPVDGYFALIDPPGAGALRFLLRAGGPAADVLRTVKPGTELGVRGPLGDGFAVEQAAGRDVLLVSAGAGIAAIRPLLVTLTPEAGRSVWLYHGTRTMHHVPFAPDLATAQKKGTHVTITISQEPGTDALVGRVQHAIERDKPALGNAVAFISGMPAMVDALRAVLPRFGLAPDRLYLNY